MAGFLPANNQLSALYYPYATPDSYRNLKRGLLVFDKIHFIVPTDYRDYRRAGVEFSDQPSAGDIYGFEEVHYSSDEPVAEGVFEIVEPATTVNEYGEDMVAALEDDRSDPALQRLQARQKDRQWRIYVEKVPGGLYNLERYRKGGVIELPFLDGESIMVSHAVYACYKRNLIPVSDETLHRQFLEARLNRGLQLYNQRCFDETGSRQDEVSFLREVIFTEIPDPADLTHHEILQFRKDNHDAFENLQTSILELAGIIKNRHRISSADYDSSIGRVRAGIRQAYEDLTGVSPMRTHMMATPAFGGLPGAALGTFSIPSIGFGLYTQTETRISRDASRDRNRLRETSVAFDLKL